MCAPSSVWICWPEKGREAEWMEETAGLLRSPKRIKIMDLRSCLAIRAARELSCQWTAPSDCRAVVVSQSAGRTFFASEDLEYSPFFPARDAEGGVNYRQAARGLPPLHLLPRLPNMTAAHLSHEFDIYGPAHSLNSPDPDLQSGIEVVEGVLNAGEADEVLWVVIKPSRGAAAALCRRDDLSISRAISQMKETL